MKKVRPKLCLNLHNTQISKILKEEEREEMNAPFVHFVIIGNYANLDTTKRKKNVCPKF